MSNRVSRRADLATFSSEVADGLVTHLVPADEVLDQHPLLAAARRHWRSNLDRRRPFCCACKTSFANGAAVGAFLFVVPDGVAKSCSVSALCVTCWRDLTDDEVERAALRVIRRIKPGFKFSEPSP